MPEDHRTGTAAFASSGKVVALPQADTTQGQDHVTWAYQTHVTAIYQYIYSRVGNRPDAEALTAQVFMKAISGMRSDVSVPELRSWLYRVAQTTLADHWREYYAEDAGELDDDVTHPPASRENPEAVLRVDSLLATLPESYRRGVGGRLLLRDPLGGEARAGPPRRTAPPPVAMRARNPPLRGRGWPQLLASIV